MKLVHACLLFVTAAGESAEMFPSLRRHLLQVQHQREQQQQATHSGDADDASDTVTAIDAAPTAAVDVPAATNLGPDGFPTLPEVSDILGGASKTLRSIDSQASVLQQQLEQKHRENQKRMSERKVVFEQKLKAQEAVNREVVAANSKIEGAIQQLKKGNDQLREQAKHLQFANRIMRIQLHTLDDKFTEARSFVTRSLTETDDSQAKELNVLRAHAKRGGLVVRKIGRDADDDSDDDKEDDKDDEKDDDQDSDDKDDDKDGKGGAESFLEVDATEGMEVEVDEAPDVTPTADPKGLVDILRSGVEQLAKEGRESEQKMHTMFVVDFRAGSQRHDALLKKQTSLIAQRTALQTLQGQLVTADDHLTATGEALQQRLRGLGLFTQKLGHLALGPVSEVSHLTDALPASIKPVAQLEETK